VVISDKLDGVSGLLSINDGKAKLYTRGNGEVGADISFFIQYLNLPSFTHSPDMVVRGELVISKKKFASNYLRADPKVKLVNGNKTYRNARNMVSGLLGGKTLRRGVSDMSFVAYEIVSDRAPALSEQLTALAKAGFKTVEWASHDTSELSIDKLSELHDSHKATSRYDIDGIVCVADRPYDRNTEKNPSYMFAFKQSSDENMMTTVVNDVVWSISKHGLLIPVVHVEPRDVQGITISKVSGASAGKLKERGIAPGATVIVTRRNEVIPYIEEVTNPVWDFPAPEQEHKWDDNKTHLVCTNMSEDNAQVAAVKICAGFFKKMDIKFVSVSTVTKLFNNGFNSLLRIIKAAHSGPSELTKDGMFAQKSAVRISENICEGLTGVTVAKILGCSGVFGSGIGQRRIDAVLKSIPGLLEVPDSKLRELVMKVEGFDDVMTGKLCAHMSGARIFIRRISPYCKLAEPVSVGTKLVGKSYVMTGFHDKDLHALLESMGATVKSSVSTKTTMVIAADPSSTSGKLTRALTLGIPVVSRSDFKVPR
jgi:DNA ligase (NAD+)